MNSNVKYKVLVLTVNRFKIYIGHLYVDFQVTYLFCTSMSLKKTLFNEDWLKDSQFYLPGLQGPVIRIKHAVNYVQLTFSLGTWGNKHF